MQDTCRPSSYPSGWSVASVQQLATVAHVFRKGAAGDPDRRDRRPEAWAVQYRRVVLSSSGALVLLFRGSGVCDRSAIFGSFAVDYPVLTMRR